MTTNTPTPKSGGTGTRTRRWIALGAAAAAVVLALAALLYVTTRPRMVAGDKLAKLFLDGQQLSTVMDAPMTVGDVSTGGKKTVGGLSKANCLGALRAAQELSYADSGYTGLRWVEARDSTEHVQHYVIQAAASFPSAERVEAFVANAAAQWRLCSDQVVVTVEPEKSPISWRLAGVVGVPPKISISESREDVRWTCQRALRAARNVVVDVTACAEHVTDQGRQLGDMVAANVGG